jgi:putative ABC transport system permease protein
MENLFKDIRFGIRSLLKRPGFTAIVVITLALGIGANSAVFSVINAVLLRPLPYRDADRVVTLWQNHLKAGIPRNDVSPANFIDWSAQSKSFASMAGIEPFGFALLGEGEPERFPVWLVTSGFFEVAGTNAFLGRTLSVDDYQPGKDRVVVIGHSLWQRRFGGDKNLVGRKLTFNGQPFLVVGIMPPQFQLPADREIWAPRVLGESHRQLRGATYWNVIARLKPGVTLAQAQEEMNGIAARLAHEYPETNGGMGATVVPLYEHMTGKVQPALWTLAGAVGFVLLIACANVANLLLVGGAERQREFAIRRALGAGRSRLLRQTLTESMLLALAGGTGGVLLASWGTKLIPALSAAKIPRLEYVFVDARVLLFTFGVSVGTAIIFGVVPAVQFWRHDLQSTLKEGGRGTGVGPARHRLRSSLVVAEVAVALVLLTGAGLLVRSFVTLLRVDPGFAKENVLALQVFLSRTYQKPEQLTGFFDQALEKIQSVPGVQSAAVVSSPPFINLEQDAPFTVVGQPAPPKGSESTAFYSEVSADYLATLSVPLRSGRFFNKFDKSDSVPVVVLNEAMARRYFPNEDPVGKKLEVMFGPTVTREIVGVIGNVLHSGLDADPRPEMFVPYQQSPTAQMTIMVKTTPPPAAMLATIKTAVRQVNPNQTFAKTATLEELVADSLKQRRFNLFLLGLFAVLALVLASIGIYGSISYSAKQRTNEIGVRVALGAQSGDVLRLIIGQGLTLALAGVGIGLLASFALTRLIKGLLFGVSATDPLTFFAISVLLTLTSILASWIPAWRATKVDPLVALRYE